MADISLEIHHLDVRGGDATAIMVYNHIEELDMENGTVEDKAERIYSVLIDAGAEGSGSDALKSYLEAHLDVNFDLGIATHYHQDHIQGFGAAAIKFKKFIDNADFKDGSGQTIRPRNGVGKGAKTTVFNSYAACAQGKAPSPPVRVKIPFMESTFDPKTTKAEPVTIELGEGTGIKLTCYCANGILANGTNVLNDQKSKRNKAISPNDVSLAFVLEWGDFRYFTAGDLSGAADSSNYYDIETSLVDYLTKGPLLGKTISVFKASHHGSEHSNTAELFDKLKPETVIISCNQQKRVPSPVFLERLTTYFAGAKDRTVVLTNSLRVFKTDERYTELEKLKGYIATGNVVFDEDVDKNLYASNLGIKCAVIRRRVKDGKVIDQTKPNRAKEDPKKKTGYDIVLIERSASEEKAIGKSLTFKDFAFIHGWQNLLCDRDSIQAGFTAQANEIIRWLKEDQIPGKDISGKDYDSQTIGRDYIFTHYPALVETIDGLKDDDTDAAKVQKLVTKMFSLFDNTFVQSADKQKWDKNTKPKETLNNDEKMTLYNLLVFNRYQRLFISAYRWKSFQIPADNYPDTDFWNIQVAPEPYPVKNPTSQTGKRKIARPVNNRDKKKDKKK